MSRLNRSYRGKTYATDVLSFPAPPVFRRQGHLGELIICLPVLKSQARELGHSAETELDVLLVHGLLHLLGMDHEKGGKAARVMRLWETRLLKGKGLIARSA
jgi:probable rRNA maturation factor